MRDPHSRHRWGGLFRIGCGESETLRAGQRFIEGAPVTRKSSVTSVVMFALMLAVSPPVSWGHTGPNRVTSERGWRVASVSVGAPWVVYSSSGDFWGPAWSTDGNLHTGANDTTGFSKGCRWPLAGGWGFDVASYVLTGDPANGTLAGENIACLAHYTSATDRADWDNYNMTSVDGTLYWDVLKYDSNVGYLATLIRSDDGGKTWCAAGPGCPPADPSNPTFSDAKGFGEPEFVDYGQDTGPGGDPLWPDGAQDYIYALSLSWRGRNYGYVVGRVLRDQIGELDPSRWQFLTGFDGSGSPTWGGVGERKYILGRTNGGPSEIGTAIATWVAPISTYVMIESSARLCSGQNDPFPTCSFDYGWYDPTRTSWRVFVSDHVWGPWSEVGPATHWHPGGTNSPVIPSKFIHQQVGCTSKGCRLGMWVLASSDWTHPRKYYHLTAVPMWLWLQRARL